MGKISIGVEKILPWTFSTRKDQHDFVFPPFSRFVAIENCRPYLRGDRMLEKQVFFKHPQNTVIGIVGARSLGSSRYPGVGL